MWSTRTLREMFNKNPNESDEYIFDLYIVDVFMFFISSTAIIAMIVWERLLNQNRKINVRKGFEIIYHLSYLSRLCSHDILFFRQPRRQGQLYYYSVSLPLYYTIQTFGESHETFKRHKTLRAQSLRKEWKQTFLQERYILIFIFLSYGIYISFFYACLIILCLSLSLSLPHFLYLSLKGSQKFNNSTLDKKILFDYFINTH